MESGPAECQIEGENRGERGREGGRWRRRRRRRRGVRLQEREMQG